MNLFFVVICLAYRQAKPKGGTTRETKDMQEGEKSEDTRECKKEEVIRNNKNHGMFFRNLGQGSCGFGIHKEKKEGILFPPTLIT